MDTCQRLLRLLVSASLLLICTAARAEPVQPTTTTKEPARESMIHEPVFQGEIFLRQAGIEHQQTIILIHGAGDQASAIWDTLIPLLTRDYHVIACDLPGFGRSTKQNKLYSPGNYSQFIDWLVHEYSDGPVILLGHSMGGALALHYGASFPDSVSRLFLVNTAGILHRTAFTKSLTQLSAPRRGTGPIPWLNDPLATPRRFLNQLTGSLLEKLERERSAEELATLLRYPPLRKLVLNGDSAAIAGLALVQEDFSKQFNKVKAPTTVIWGETDSITPLRTGRLLTGLLPNAHLRLIADCGHVPMIEQPDRFQRLLLTELANPPGKQPPAPPLLQHEAIGRCDGENGKVFSGMYPQIEITGCHQVILEDVRTEAIIMQDSTVQMDNCTIIGKQAALHLTNTSLVGTILHLEGDVAINASQSRIDLAGATLIGHRAAIESPDSTTLTFSVSSINSPHTSGSLHRVLTVTSESPL